MVEFPKKAIETAVKADVDGLEKAHEHYGTSWKNRGGIGAFMMLARKWDRLEQAVEKYGYDIFKTIEGDTRAEGIMDDIRDLRRYLLLVEAEFDIPQINKDGPSQTYPPLSPDCAITCMSRVWDKLANRRGGCSCGAVKGKGPAISHQPVGA